MTTLPMQASSLAPSRPYSHTNSTTCDQAFSAVAATINPWLGGFQPNGVDLGTCITKRTAPGRLEGVLT